LTARQRDLAFPVTAVTVYDSFKTGEFFIIVVTFIDCINQRTAIAI
jgi:hypothetical protein